MKLPDNNKGLLNQERFEILKRDNREYLRNLSLDKAVKIQESLMSSKLIKYWQGYSRKDRPVNLKRGLHLK